jgi:hypothetical protein
MCLNWLATSLKNECKDALVSGKMRGLPIYESLELAFLEM